MRHAVRSIILFALALALPEAAAPGALRAQDAAPDGSPLGFGPEAAAAQRAREARLDSLTDARNLERWMRRMTAHPQHVGSPGARANAEFVDSLFRAWGYESEIVEYRVLFPTPRERELELVAPRPYRARLQEPEIAGDRTSGIRQGRLPPYNAYSADGEVTGELVYVNYGIPADYEELERRGIDVRDKIVIARYGASWRGIKPKVAAEHGAIGTILYSDPRDDGYYRGDVYPEGAFKNEHGVQRGSVADMPRYPGDPLTPGVGATPDAERLPREEAPTLMTIPVLPISYGDARPLLEALGGPVAPESWRGALPITYHIGPGPAVVRLKLSFDWKLAPAYNVIARLPGAELPDEWVIRGNHRDAWVFGAQDPTSGMVALLEEARAVGGMARRGDRPRRTIVYASWDAEEPGLLGSTEWAEHHAAELREKAVAYINTDSNGRGFLGAGGSQTLEILVDQAARAVEDPQTGVSVVERSLARARAGGGDPEDGIRLSPLGSGSDYTPFLQHLGIASLNLGFGGENAGGSYHSTYDSFDHYVRFGDPGFRYGVALARTAGRATLRLANAEVLPLALRPFADHVARYAREVEELADRMREETERHNRLVDADAFRLAADPTEPFVPPESKDPVPHLNFAPLRNAVASLERAAAAYDDALDRAAAAGTLPAGAAREELNRLLRGLEGAMTREEGLPRRPWFRHQVYAPGFYTGYGVKTLPGIREAVEERKWEEFEEQMGFVAATLQAVAGEMERAARLVGGEAAPRASPPPGRAGPPAGGTSPAAAGANPPQGGRTER